MSERLLREQKVIDAITDELDRIDHVPQWVFDRLRKAIEQVPSAEPLTDIEQRIFLAAMRKEEEVCRKVDKEIDGDINLTKVCKEIERKVKGALWT